MNRIEEFRGAKASGVSSPDTSQASPQAPMSNGGILGSGIFGSVGTFINCKAEDTSMYCNFMKFMNVFIMLLFLIGIIYLIYTFASYYFSKGKK